MVKETRAQWTSDRDKTEYITDQTGYNTIRKEKPFTNFRNKLPTLNSRLSARCWSGSIDKAQNSQVIRAVSPTKSKGSAKSTKEYPTQNNLSI